MVNKITFEDNTLQQMAPSNVYNVSATSGTYQASAGNRKKLHRLTATADIYINRGTGAAVVVTDTTGNFVPAGQEVYFHALEGAESLGWFAAAVARVTIGIVSL